MHPLHVLKPCKNRAETVHLLPDKLKTTSSDNDLTALVRVTAHQKSSLGGYDYDEITFLPLQYGHQPGEARFAYGTTLAIDCIAVEDEYGNSSAQRAELDWLLYNRLLEYAQLVLGGEMEYYLSLGCDHGRLED